MTPAIIACVVASIAAITTGTGLALKGRVGLGWTFVISGVGIGTLPFIIVWEAMR